MIRALRRLVLALGFVALAASVALGLAYPLLPAALCPACFGLEQIGDGVIVEAGTPALWRAETLEMVAQAQAHVDAELGRPEPRRRIILCASPDCAARLGTGGAFGLTLSTPFGAVVYLAPEGRRPTILRHELAHVAIHGHAGVMASLNGALPAWLDEGLAVVVSDDPGHLRGGVGPSRCAAPPEGLVVNPFDFARAAFHDRAQYTRSACAALHFEAQLGGRSALVAALQGVRQGVPLPALALP